MPTRVCKYSNNVECPKLYAPTDFDCASCQTQVCRPDTVTAPPESKDVVTRPAHYIEGRKYEPKDVIRDWRLNYNLGCAVKYISRAGRKDDILQDLRKAQTYLGFEIEALEKERTENDSR